MRDGGCAFLQEVVSFPIRAVQVTQRNVGRGTSAKEADEWAAVAGVLLSMFMDASGMGVNCMLMTCRNLGIISAAMGPKMSWMLDCRSKPMWWAPLL